MAFHGANIDDLDRLAKELKASALSTAAARSQLASAVSRLSGWTGPDAERFKNSWSGTYSPNLLKISNALTEASTAISRNSHQQKSTSNDSNSASMSTIFAAQAARDVAVATMSVGLLAMISSLSVTGRTKADAPWYSAAKEGSADYTAMKEDYYKRQLVGEAGSKKPFEPTFGVKADLISGERSAFVHEAEARAGYKTSVGGIEVSDSVAAYAKTSATVSGSAGINQDGMFATAGAHLTAKAGIERSTSIGAVHMGQGVSVKADVGGDIDVGIGRRPDGSFGAGGSAHAGASVSAEAHQSVEVGGVKATTSASVSAGLDAEAKIDAGFHNGKLSLDYKIGATLGIGGKFGGNIEIDTKQAAHAAKAVGGFISKHNPF